MDNKVINEVIRLTKTYEIINDCGILYAKIPLTELLDKVEAEIEHKEVGVLDIDMDNKDIVFITTREIDNLYALKHSLAELKDCDEYLRTVAKCWQYHDTFADTILKAVARRNPNLNRLAYHEYGERADSILKDFIFKNKNVIRKYWYEDETKN